MAIRDFQSANIIPAQFDAFYQFITDNYKSRASMHTVDDTESQKIFYNILFKDADSEIIYEYQNINDFWIRMMRDFFAKNMNLGNNVNQLRQLNEQTVDTRKEFLREVMARCFVDFRDHQRPN